MKIQAARAEELASTQTQQTDRTRGARSEPASPVSDAVVTDRFEKSPDAQLAEMAVRARGRLYPTSGRKSSSAPSRS